MRSRTRLFRIMCLSSGLLLFITQWSTKIYQQNTSMIYIQHKESVFPVSYPNESLTKDSASLTRQLTLQRKVTTGKVLKTERSLEEKVLVNPDTRITTHLSTKGDDNSAVQPSTEGRIRSKKEGEKPYTNTRSTKTKPDHYSKRDYMRSQNRLSRIDDDTYNRKMSSECQVMINCSKGSNPAFDVDLNNVTLEQVTGEHPDITVGGHWRPRNCLSKPLAMIIPYRDRKQHLSILLRNIIKFLKIQQRAFDVYVIEQGGDTLFNRASLLNIGFLEAMKRYNYSCFIFHDVDMVPVRLCNIYDCPQTGARHMAVSINKNPTKIYYKNFTGGVLSLRTWAMKRINGFTNIMFGWGGEDDNASARLNLTDISIQRFNSDVANYSMVAHARDKSNPDADRGLEICYQTSLHYKQDGLNNVKYKLVSSMKYPLFTKITVELEGPKTLEEALIYFDEKRTAFGQQLNITSIKSSNLTTVHTEHTSITNISPKPVT